MEPYRLSFTFGGLLIPETRIIADVFLTVGEWPAVREKVINENLLHKTRQASSRRYIREIRDRLKGAHDWEIPIVAGRNGGPDDLRLVALALAARYYRLFREFLVEVVRHKVVAGDYQLLGYEFASFWERKAEGAQEMRNVSETTRKKIEQVTLRMLAEGGLIPSGTGKNTITRPVVPARLAERYAYRGDMDSLLSFLLTDQEISAIKSRSVVEA